MRTKNVVTAFAVELALWPACHAADEIRKSAELTASPDVVEMTTHYVNDPLCPIDPLVDVRAQKTRQKLSR